MRRGTGYDANDKWRAGEAEPLGLDTPGVFSRMRLCINRGENFTGPGTPLALEQEETPGRQLAMIGHPRRERQENFGLSGRWTGSRHRNRRRRASGSQKRDRSVHQEFMLFHIGKCRCSALARGRQFRVRCSNFRCFQIFAASMSSRKSAEWNQRPCLMTAGINNRFHHHNYSLSCIITAYHGKCSKRLTRV